MFFIWNIVKFSFVICFISQTLYAMDTQDVQPNLDKFKYCVRQAKHPSLRECIGRTALSFLQSLEERDNFTLTQGFVAARDENVAASRSLVNFLDTDPVDFRGIMENAGAVFSQRNLEFHMDTLYPGLMLKIGPTADAKSVAEFVIDTTVDERNFDFQEASTARVLAKQYLVPFLLGVKFNLVALVPLLFAGICLLLKKSLFFVKLAIYVSSVLGVGGALGSLGGLGGGLGGALGGFGSFAGTPHHHAAPHPQHGPHALGGAGYFPGKAMQTLFNGYDYEDDLHHNTPYKRTDRKLKYEQPREFVSRLTTTAAPSADRFYEYEKQSMLQDRSGKSRSIRAGGKLGPSAYEDEDISGEESAAIEQLAHSFKTNDRERLGWQVIDVRP